MPGSPEGSRRRGLAAQEMQPEGSSSSRLLEPPWPPKVEYIYESTSELSKTTLSTAFHSILFFLHFPWRTIGDSQKTIPLNMVCAGPSSWSCRSLTCVPCLY